MIKVPDQLHASLKELATKRACTVVDVLHSFVRRAIEEGELPDEVPGMKVYIDLDTPENVGPFIIITTSAGNLPGMDVVTAEKIAAALSLEVPLGEETVRNRLDANGHWAVGVRGTSVELFGKERDESVEDARRVVMSKAIARDLAAKIRKVANSAR